jgi:hypothetical protein
MTTKFQVGDAVEFRVFDRRGRFTFETGVVSTVVAPRFPGEQPVYYIKPSNLGEHTPFHGKTVPFLEDELYKVSP